MRGPCPGLGSALHAFGVDQSTLVVRQLEPLIPENDDPWEIVERAMEDPHAAAARPAAAPRDQPTQASGRSSEIERRALLKLVSRFALSPIRPSAGISPTSGERRDRLSGRRHPRQPLPALRRRSLRAGSNRRSHRRSWRIPAESCGDAHPLPSPSGMQDSLDVRRARALMVTQLEHASAAGDTLLPANRVTAAHPRVRARPAVSDRPGPAARLRRRVATGHRRNPRWPTAAKAFQLDRLRETKQVIQRFVERRQTASRHEEEIPWRPRTRRGARRRDRRGGSRRGARPDREGSRTRGAVRQPLRAP